MAKIKLFSKKDVKRALNKSNLELIEDFRALTWIGSDYSTKEDKRSKI